MCIPILQKCKDKILEIYYHISNKMTPLSYDVFEL